MEKSEKINRVISKEDYYKLRSFQNVHSQLMGVLEILELNFLEITNEVDSEGRLLMGSYSADALNMGTKEALDDVLKILGIEVEKDKVVEVVKSVSKVSKKKKKDSFKSGRWQKDGKLNKPVEVVDGKHLHYFNEEFINNEKRVLTQEELDEIMAIGVEVEDDEVSIVPEDTSNINVRKDWDDKFSKFSQFDESDDSDIVDIFDDDIDNLDIDIFGEAKG